MKPIIKIALLFLIGILLPIKSLAANDSLIGRGDNSKQFYLQDSKEPFSAFLRKAKQFFEVTEPYQNYFGTQVSLMANQVDEWVGGDMYISKSNQSEFVIKLRNRYETSLKKYSLDTQFRAKLFIPNTKKRFNLYIESVRGGIYNSLSGTDSIAAQAPVANDNAQNDTIQTTLRGSLFNNKHFKLWIDAGGSFQGIQPAPLVGIRSQVTFANSTEHQNLLAQKVYWQRFKGDIFNSLYRHDWRLNNYKLIRFETEAIWFNTNRYWTTSQTISLYDKINVHRFFTYSLRGDWSSLGYPFHNNNYGVGFSWRERAYKKLVYVALNPYLNCRQDMVQKKYYIEPSIELNIEFHFFKPTNH